MNFERMLEITDKTAWKNAYEEEIRRLDLLYQEEERLYYDMYTSGKQSTRLNEIQKTKHEIMTNKYYKEMMSYWKQVFRTDKIWSRRLSVLLSRMEAEKLDSSPQITRLQQKLQKSLLESSVKINGKDYTLGAIHSNIMENPDRDMRKNLLCGAVGIGRNHEERFRDLIKQRNELAKQAGFENYFYFKCHLKGLDFDRYSAELATLLESSGKSSQDWKNRIKDKFEWKVIHQYDQYYSVFNYHQLDGSLFPSNRLNTVLKGIMESLKVDADNMPFSAEIHDIPYGGFCINISPEEIKLVVSKRDSYSVYLSAIHEMGHALDGYFSSFEYPEMYRFYSSIAAEGIAELFQTIVTDHRFLNAAFQFDQEMIQSLNELKQLTDIKLLSMNHYYSLVEFKLYKNSDRDFKKIAEETYFEVFGEEGETFHPASEMFYIENPVFFQDYNVALSIREMILEKFNMESPYGNPAFFQELLEKFIQPNQLYTWEERVERLCREPHTFRYLAESLSNHTNAE
ncbi:hypothetical protein ACOJQI_13030 [Bacillus salacetis]|uniref:hypothetical protein n=1 Tax=Bacillus salacetis TaxID=2315464 RepID=UPI003BA0A39B